MHRRVSLASLPVLAMLSFVVPAQAADTWTTPHPGMRHLYRTVSDPNRIHALVVDMCAAGVSMRATASTERKRTVSSFGNLVGAEAAVNGDFFSYTGYGTVGLSIGNGVRWTDTSDGAGEGFAAFGPGKAYLSFPDEVVSNPAPWMEEVVSGRPTIVKDGAAIHSYDCSGHYCQRHPRTAFGFSQNRRTLYLLVVDGRTSVSIGMTLSQLADLMKGLGAYDAVNFDGGGSTTMWIRGNGVVNAPSDGSERVVANHLAVQATGSGMPGNCAEDPAGELLVNAHLLDGASTTDIDGDGKADLCARAAAGFRCHPSSGTGFGAAVTLDDLADSVGWDDPANYATIRMGDVNGDGLADVCARANAGMRCWPSTGTAFGPAITGPALSDASGYDAIQYYSTLRLADVTGDGKDDICVRSASGVQCYPSTGTGFGGAIDGPTLSDASGWGGIDHYGTLRTGDVNGDGKLDLCARAAAGMKCWLSTGAGFPTAIDGPAWSDASGWSEPRYWSTIQLVDITGDGKADLCGRASAGLVCHASTGNGFGPEIAGPGLSDAQGWADQSNYLTMRMADIDADGKADVCLRANAGIVCYKSTGSGFGAAVDGPDLSDTSGWWQEKFFRTIRLADIDGDKKADLCARNSERVQCWKSTGSGFSTAVDGPQWADSVGWGGRPYYSTIRVAGPRPIVEPEPDAGPEAGIDAGAGGSGGGAADASVPQDASALQDASESPDASGGSDVATGQDVASGADTSVSGDAATGADGGGVLPEEATSSDGGCGCSVPGRERGAGWVGVGLLALVVRRMRRRQAA